MTNEAFVMKKTTMTARMVVQLLKSDDRRVSRADFAKHVRRPGNQVHANVRTLMQRGIITQIGNGKEALYELSADVRTVINDRSGFVICTVNGADFDGPMRQSWVSATDAPPVKTSAPNSIFNFAAALKGGVQRELENVVPFRSKS